MRPPAATSASANATNQRRFMLPPRNRASSLWHAADRLARCAGHRSWGNVARHYPDAALTPQIRARNAAGRPAVAVPPGGRTMEPLRSGALAQRAPDLPAHDAAHHALAPTSAADRPPNDALHPAAAHRLLHARPSDRAPDRALRSPATDLGLHLRASGRAL